MFNKIFDAVVRIVGWCLGIGVTLVLATLFFCAGLGWLGFIIVFLLLCGILEAIFDATGSPVEQKKNLEAHTNLMSYNYEYSEVLKDEALRERARQQVQYNEFILACAKQPTPNAHKSPRGRANEILKRKVTGFDKPAGV
jgi:hypothetical protein